MATTYAGRVAPADVASPALRTMICQGAFMTEVVRQGIPPTAFTDDLRLVSTTDTSYRQVENVDDGLVRFLGLPAYLWFLALAVAVLGLLWSVTLMGARRAARVRRGSAGASP